MANLLGIKQGEPPMQKIITKVETVIYTDGLHEITCQKFILKYREHDTRWSTTTYWHVSGAFQGSGGRNMNEQVFAANRKHWEKNGLWRKEIANRNWANI